MVQLLRQLTTDNPRQKLNFQKYLLLGNKFCKWAEFEPLQTGLKTFQYKVVQGKVVLYNASSVKSLFYNFFLVSIVLRNSQLYHAMRNRCESFPYCRSLINIVIIKINVKNFVGFVQRFICT